ncbi:ribonuclease P protein component 1 [Halogeometricum sp. S1BR25-6]|uniref:Ribonuclease P protein component 1 n=1 Tax=Halogeometricum salsisoli TaxID=2950536 RepID=A0ABU2GFL0_9EURY|nr:ribonuclease P protein component 1 [Halogeometricum sp. S1BR25-6]MDS0299582.1 ribonuclease P protein component 1 [Halogeometricum sp. S1BR25-6]
MALTPETLTRHELNGLRVEVVDAANPDLVGIAGRVVVETMQTLHVDVDASESEASDDGETRVLQVPKQGATLQFEIPSRDDAPASARERTDEAADAEKASGTASKLRSETAGRFEAGQSGRCQGAAYVTVDGARLLSRPALRTEKAGDTTWR